MRVVYRRVREGGRSGGGRGYTLSYLLKHRSCHTSSRTFGRPSLKEVLEENVVLWAQFFVTVGRMHDVMIYMQ